MKYDTPITHFLIIAAGLVLCGYFIGNGFVKSRTTDRFVTVKGVSELDVKADVAVWPIAFGSTNDDLSLAQRNVDKSKNAILAFLKKQGIDESNIEIQRFEVVDKIAQPYMRPEQINSRYIISQTITVRSENAALIQSASQKVSELVEAGVVF